MRSSRWRYLEECDRLHWKFKAGRLTREEMSKFCSVFGLTHLVGFGAGGLPLIALVSAANVTNFVLFTAAGSPAFPVIVEHTINSGIYVYSTSVATPGYDVGSGWVAGSKGKLICASAFVLGKGGRGCTWSGGSGTAPEAGGTALKLQANLEFSIDNLNGYVAGGGGGGGGVKATYQVSKYSSADYRSGGGGGAGGGDGGDGNVSPGSNSSGGTGGGPGSAGTNGGIGSLHPLAGSGAGRILPGTGGAGANNDTVAQGGESAGGGGSFNDVNGSTFGGVGGSSNNVGGNAVAGIEGTHGGGGGGWGAAGGNYAYGTAGATNVQTFNPAAGGKCVDLNGQSVVWINNGNRYGAIA